MAEKTYTLGEWLVEQRSTQIVRRRGFSAPHYIYAGRGQRRRHLANRKGKGTLDDAQGGGMRVPSGRGSLQNAAPGRGLLHDPNVESAGADFLVVLCFVLLFLWAVWPQ